jgi:hypothetical protein
VKPNHACKSKQEAPGLREKAEEGDERQDNRDGEESFTKEFVAPGPLVRESGRESRKV